MKKSILFGALAFFAISALGIQEANAQNAETKIKKTDITSVKEEKEAKPAPNAVMQEPVKQRKDDCCADKKVAPDKKKECCAEKKVSDGEKQMKPECKKECKHGEKQAKPECKKECKHGEKKCDGKKPELKKIEKSEAKETATDK